VAFSSKLIYLNMTRHLFLFLLLLGLQFFAMGQGKKVTAAFNPTGTYKMGSKTGYNGTIRVKLINRDTIVMSLYVCIGPPNYNSGSFVDTLVYQNHRAVYHHAESDTTCRIIFSFTGKEVSVEQVQPDPNSGCGFGHAVFADGYYKKVSAKVPVIQEEDDE
jgi:hypothetical protein